MGLNVNDLVRAELLHSDENLRLTPSPWAGMLRQLVRIRFQLLFGAMAAVFLPAFIMRSTGNWHAFETYLSPTQLGALLAFLFGFYTFRNVASFPGVRATSFILPSFGAGFALVGLLLLALRIDFAHIQFAMGFLTTIICYFALFFLVRRVQRPTFILIPGGRIDDMLSITTVDWIVAATPATCGPSAPLVADLQADLTADWLRFIADAVLTGRPVYNYKEAFESITGRVQIRHMSENLVGALEPNRIYASGKRYIDFLLALLALAASSWLMLLVAIAIRLDSKGPVIFCQERMGYQGRPFTIYKFRTMHVLSPEEELNNRHLHDADRISRLGRWLRRTRLDELPQLVNILRGEMSFIGPRPEAMSLSAEYEANIPFYRYRHVVRPGVAGWAQVNQGHVVGIAAADLKLQYDFFYIKNFSLWLDMLVTIKTIKVIILGVGAR